MKIGDPNLSAKTPETQPAQLKAPNPTALLDKLQINPGQSLLAKVFAQSPEAVKAGATRLLLEVLGQKVPVDSDVPLKTGTLVRIQREANHLRLMEALPADTRQQATQNLAHKLPFQHSLAGGLKALESLMQQLPAQSANKPSQATTPQQPTGTSQTSAVSPNLRAALEKLFAQIPRQSELVDPVQRAPQKEAAAIREWISRSGLFSEAQMARTGSDGARTPPPDNLKTALLNLAKVLLKTDAAGAARELQQLKPMVSPELLQQPLQFPQTSQPPSNTGREPMNTGQMLRMLAGMINRITTHQLHTQALSLPAPQEGAAPPTPTWLLELPWLGTDGPKVAELRLERWDLERREGDEDGEEERKKQSAQWRLALALDLDELGPVFFDVAVEPGSVAATIWAQRETTWRLVKQESPLFHESLSNLGLNVKRLECQRGHPHRPRTQLEHRLVDEKA